MHFLASVLIGDRSSKFGSKISSDDDEMEDNASALLFDHYSKYIYLSLSKEGGKGVVISLLVIMQQKNVSKKCTTKTHRRDNFG